MMITLIGVGHVFDINRSLENAILRRNPSVVCVELDAARYHALLAEEKGRGGDIPFVYRVLSRFQERIARKYGAQVGSEMLTAVQTAGTVNAKVAFIDMDASIIVSNFWKSMSFRERGKFVLALFSGMFVRKKRIEKELRRFEEEENNILDAFGKEFPTAKRLLIDDRNRHMARAISELAKEHKNIVAVVGDGHVEGIRTLLLPLEVETIRLRQLRSTESNNGNGVSFSYEVSYSDPGL
jgi:pheromone shutdown protein TraB